jgi:hypothetical protein
MAKELPYFQFEPAEYLTKDISFCSLSAQGLFINICSFYWQRQCDLSKDQFLRRFNYLNEFEELIKEGVIDVINEKIFIKFLDIQYLKATEFSKEQSRKGSLGGRPKKPSESQIKPELKPNESQTKAIREEKIREEEIIVIKNENKHEIFKDECLQPSQWLDVVSMNEKIPLDKMLFALNDFNKNLIINGEVKLSLKDYKYHFASWVRKMKQYKAKEETNKNIGKL